MAENKLYEEIDRLRAENKELSDANVELVAYKISNYDPAESIRLNAEIMRLVIICNRLKAAIERCTK